MSWGPKGNCSHPVLCSFCHRPDEPENPVKDVDYFGYMVPAHLGCVIDESYAEFKDAYASGSWLR